MGRAERPVGMIQVAKSAPSKNRIMRGRVWRASAELFHREPRWGVWCGDVGLGQFVYQVLPTSIAPRHKGLLNVIRACPMPQSPLPRCFVDLVRCARVCQRHTDGCRPQLVPRTRGRPPLWCPAASDQYVPAGPRLIDGYRRQFVPRMLRRHTRRCLVMRASCGEVRRCRCLGHRRRPLGLSGPRGCRPVWCLRVSQLQEGR